MSTSTLYRLVFAALFVLAASNAHAATISFVAVNPIGSPDFFTEFSGLAEPFETAPKTFDGFIFAQPDGDPGADIWTTYNPGNSDGKVWYPNGGDFGYTEIQLSNGTDFTDAALFVGSGFANNMHSYLAYELLNNGISIQSGVLSGHTTLFHWLLIDGGGYDTIRLRDGSHSGIAVGDGTYNTLAFDKVAVGAVAVPDFASSQLLLGIGLAGLAGLGRRFGL